MTPLNCGDYRLSRNRSPATAVMLQASTRWFSQHVLNVDQPPTGIEYLHPNPEIHPPLKGGAYPKMKSPASSVNPSLCCFTQRRVGKTRKNTLQNSVLAATPLIQTPKIGLMRPSIIGTARNPQALISLFRRARHPVQNIVHTAPCRQSPTGRTSQARPALTPV